ncbi:MAG: rod-binding protein [Lachnospiraceae bacterium]|nr:rod-binding protein [Lachnospiraceae bacterium]
MEISGMSSMYTDYIASTATNQTTKLAENVSAESSDEELLEACKEFESYFIEQVFNAMMETTKVFSDEEENDSYATKMVDYFKDSAVQELTDQATGQNGLGIAQTLYEQMKRQYSALTPEEVAAAASATTEEK